MKIEVLFPEIANLYGDLFNIKYLEKILPDAKFYYTNLNESPHFLKEKIDLVYMGSMSEKSQEIVVKKLRKYTLNIKKYINDNNHMLFTGNSGEILGKYIIKDDGTKIKCLNIISFYSKRDMMNRYNYIELGKYKDIDIVGFKSGFTYLYGDNRKKYFIKIKKGIGINKESKLEGFKINNLIITSLLGPFLILNPIFLKLYLSNLGYNGDVFLEKEMTEAYKKRLNEFVKIK